MRFARFNEAGLARFNEFLDELTANPHATLPLELLEDEGLCITIGLGVDVNPVLHESRLEAAQFIDRLFQRARAHESDIEAPGTWAWLSLLLFDSVCPAKGNGVRKRGSKARYLVDPSWARRYRHLLAGPYRVYRAHKERPDGAMILLCGKPHIPGEIAEQLFAQHGVIQNKSAVELATLIYFDPATGSFRRGAGGDGKGSARRLGSFLGQLDVTWDLGGMTAQELLRHLPKEFAKFAKYA